MGGVLGLWGAWVRGSGGGRGRGEGTYLCNCFHIATVLTACTNTKLYMQIFSHKHFYRWRNGSSSTIMAPEVLITPSGLKQFLFHFSSAIGALCLVTALSISGSNHEYIMRSNYFTTHKILNKTLWQTKQRAVKGKEFIVSKWMGNAPTSAAAWISGTA